MATDELYPDVVNFELEPYYTRHVSGMTSHGLHDKADIAEQLAWRDQRIEALAAELAAAKQERDEALDRLELEQLDHDVTRGYRQHAEQLLAAATKRETETRAELAEANDRARMLQGIAESNARLAEAAEKREAELHAALEWLHGWDGEQLGLEAIGDHGGTGPSIAAALIRAHREAGK
jgi:chromosome segregation ATPase